MTLRKTNGFCNLKMDNGGSIASHLFGVPALTVPLPGSNKLPLVVTNMIAKFPNNTVKHISVKRTPLPSFVNKAMNILTLGQFQKNVDEQGIDTLFHLYMEVQLDNGTTVIMEKNSRLNMEIVKQTAPRKDTQEIIISPFPSGMTIRSMMANVEKLFGLKKLIAYSAKSNNCQDFVMGLCQSNGFGTTADFQFIKQDTATLFKNMDYLRKISNTVTGLDASVNQVMKGGKLTKGGGVSWITFVKQEQLQHNCSYKEALVIASKLWTK